MVRLIAIDLDGTLLNNQGLITKENIEALHFAHQKGVKIVICTGRPYFSMKDFVSEIGLNSEDDFIITFNGGLVQKAADGEIIKQHILTTHDLKRWDDLTQQLALPLNLIDQSFVYEPHQYPENHPSVYLDERKNLATRFMNFDEFDVEHEFNKFVICCEPDYLNQQIKLIPEMFLIDYSVFKSRTNLLEIVEKSVTKGNILLELANYLHIDAQDLMAIGDQENDLTMIEAAGIGVAMENAVDSVKEAAQYITASNDNNGVAQAIYHYIK
ncbi:HAD family phosphatase [Tuanshanicoccus lijuaniae]|uniref:Cof-type HAD-IIB family hydrolase n=1 Tax=Aerococcaceae bacterium zg-1292 TaxID=2774330 RepID=UPI001938C062|nr:HAD family phosphatase [Aerococcaceae bacterium zg-1292]MBF6625650.1 HAD family phosphatase [Aerococcaceae bacterium zg-BR9]MBF6977833.1 HAD family phosphatase [Aerococcaceae bacterium zg-BR22]MBS4455958.1 HAD family phosphatase [Aerococcaceae bacterium zg-A91]MBS4457710.1 HAD family phosphatase [Aerococcaceae bacterium zg-BR33]